MPSRRARPQPSPSSLLLAASLSLAAAAGCTPAHFRIAPYRDDPRAAATLSTRAAEACASLRGSADLPPHPFTSDGCSMAPDGTWLACCIEHDLAYWCGGGIAARRQADRRLRSCVVAHDGSKLTGFLAYATTRVGGSACWPFPWRWGYGWDPGRGYDRSGPALQQPAAWPESSDREDAR